MNSLGEQRLVVVKQIRERKAMESAPDFPDVVTTSNVGQQERSTDIRSYSKWEPSADKMFQELRIA